MLTFKCPNCGFRCGVLSYPVTCRCRTRVEENGQWLVLPPVTEAPPEIVECPYRSKNYRLVPCPSCRGEIKIKVYRCKQYDECQVEGYIEGVRVCTGARA